MNLLTPHQSSSRSTASPSIWDPLREISHLENRLERFFNRPLSRWLAGNGEKELMTITEWAPLVDISEDEQQFIVKAELPDLKKEEVKVVLENGELTISGERKLEKEEKGKRYHRIERSYGTFLRSFSLPDGVNGEKVTADFSNGILEVRLPKDATAKPEAIEVKIR